MSNRREFMAKIVSGAATVAVSGFSNSSKVLGANDRVRIGLIGAGGRGKEILKAAVGCPNTEAVAVADLYTRRLEEAKQIVPEAKTYSDFRRLLDDKSIDAVLIATPHHQHALNFVPAIQAGKDVYQEKTMAFNPDHARRMRRAFEGSGRVVQVGVQSTSGPAVEHVSEHLNLESMGTITALHTLMFRNSPCGGWMREIPPDCDLQHVDWNAFQGEVAPHPFDPKRFINWRFFWDTSGGNVFENMVHQVGFWFKLLNLQIPSKVTMVGVNLLNERLKERLNPSSSKREWKLGSSLIREGDRLMVIKNDYLLNIYNGDMGKLKSIEGDHLVVTIHGIGVGSMDTQVKIPKASASRLLKLAYAITVHKSQGSEFDTILLPITRSQGRMLQRNLFYTAVTRARKKVWLLGDSEAVLRAIDNDQVVQRNTVLGRVLSYICSSGVGCPHD